MGTPKFKYWLDTFEITPETDLKTLEPDLFHSAYHLLHVNMENKLKESLKEFDVVYLHVPYPRGPAVIPGYLITNKENVILHLRERYAHSHGEKLRQVAKDKVFKFKWEIENERIRSNSNR